MYEELTFATRLLTLPEVGTADVTMTCSYPYTSWALRRPRRGKRPPHVFVTQNGDWGPQQSGLEPSFFSCEGLICTNPLYLERNRQKWHSTLIPNGSIRRASFRARSVRPSSDFRPIGQSC